MKKFTIAFIILLVTFSSCSKSDTNTQVPILLKKRIITNSSGSVNKTSFTYNGNKIVSCESIITGIDNYKELYTYTGDKITKIELYDTTNNSLTKTCDYTYLNGVLSTQISTSAGSYFKDKKLYIKNTDGTVNFEESTINTATNLETTICTGKYTYTNGNFFKSEFTIGNKTTTTINEYDNKNNPMKNILGFNLFFSEAFVSFNNLTESTQTYGTAITTYSAIYTYNENKYPIQLIDDSGTTQYFY